jgi:hypothetical protein
MKGFELLFTGYAENDMGFNHTYKSLPSLIVIIYCW